MIFVFEYNFIISIGNTIFKNINNIDLFYNIIYKCFIFFLKSFKFFSFVFTKISFLYAFIIYFIYFANFYSFNFFKINKFLNIIFIYYIYYIIFIIFSFNIRIYNSFFRGLQLLEIPCIFVIFFVFLKFILLPFIYHIRYYTTN